MAKEIKVLLFRGTGAPLKGDGIMQAYEKALGDWADIEYIDYPASYGQPSYDISINKGVAMGLDALRRTNKRAIAMGYSQGADVAAYLHALLNGTMKNVNGHNLEGCELSYSFVVADPSRDGRAENLNGAVGGWGIRGARFVGRNHMGVANPGDPICAYPEGPLRTFADFSSYFGDPDAVNKIRKIVREKQLQPWWRQTNPADWFRSWGQAIGWLNNYMGGFHTDQYYNKGLVKQLSDRTNYLVQQNLLGK